MPVQESTYRFAVGHTADLVIITDTESIIQYVNPAFTHITGYAPDEVVGRKPSVQASSHTTLEHYRDIWSAVLSQGWWRGEIINRRKSGEEWVANLSISQVKNESGETVAYVGIATDITGMKRLQEELREAGLEAIYMLSIACEAKDEATGNHVGRVQHYAHALALKLGLPTEQAEEIGYSSIMHDVGKIHVPDGILQKPGPLSTEEWTKMRRHPADGVRVLRYESFYETARQIAENHHERWDGKGYPHGKHGEDIPLAARIVTVADMFDALSTRRPYKEAWPVEDSIRELEGQKGRALDPAVVDAFVALHEDGTVAEIRERFP